MKKKILFWVLIFTQLSVYSQNNLEIFNGYKYIVIQTIKYKDGSYDKYGISNQIKEILKSKGFRIIQESELKTNPPEELKQNPYLILACTINHDDWIFHEVAVNIFNKNRDLIYSGTGEAELGSDKGKAERATNRAMKKIIYELNYTFNPDFTPKVIIPEVEQTTETEETLKKYYSENKLNQIEGIYKSYQGENLPYYKIGIKERENKYIAIIIEAEQEQIWKPGEVKAFFEPSTMKGVYSAKWYNGNKTSNETFALMENEAILSIESENPANGEKMTFNFIKMYPPASGDVTFNDKSKSSGSGFFVTTDGVIGTNAHVVENAESIKIQISNEIGKFEYSAKILLVDNQNDIALIKIEDEKFQGLSSIPYSLVEKAEIGEKAFTIGYPLNDVMGTNYKVTDGIVSAISGIEDDMRYYQVSVPLQPGNSGGPLFNDDGNIIGITSARLNSKAVGANIENVNYAIKISYLLNLYNMLPNADKLNTTPTQSNKELQDQVKILKNYVCLIKIN